MAGLYESYSAPYELDNIFGDYDYGQNGGGMNFNQAPQNGYQDFGSIMGGVGAGMQGISGLYGMYLGKQQLNEQKKNNSLYRRLAQEQQTNRNNFVSGTKANMSASIA